MSSRSDSGVGVQIYMPNALYDHIQREALDAGVSMASWVRDRLLEACPADVVNASKAKQRPLKTGAQREPTSTVSKPKAAPPPPPPTDAELVDKHRVMILELDSKAYSATAIASVLRIPYRVVQEALYSKAKPKKGPL